MDYIDGKCSSISDCIFYSLYIVLIPVKYLCKFITNHFQRPYSLCFLLDFFLLITPSLLLVILLTQYSDFINSISPFNKIFYFTFTHLIINYVVVFYIYHLYGQHSLEEGDKLNYTVKSFTKFVVHYLFKETKMGYIGIYFLVESIASIISLNSLHTNKDYNSDVFAVPVLLFFTKLAVGLNLIFTLLHVIVYVSLFLFVLCKVNNSCIFKVIKAGCKGDTNDGHTTSFPKSNKTNTNIRENKHSFKNLSLDFYQFIGIYEYKKQLGLNNTNSNSNIIDLGRENDMEIHENEVENDNEAEHQHS